MHSSVPRQVILGAVPVTSRYYLQEYITLQKRYKIDNDQKLASSDFFWYIYYFYSFNLTYIKYKYANYAVIRYAFCACAYGVLCYLEPSIVFKAKVARHVRIGNKRYIKMYNEQSINRYSLSFNLEIFICLVLILIVLKQFDQSEYIFDFLENLW